MVWTRKEPREFRPRGALAIDPKAFGLLFALAEEPTVAVVDGVARVTVRGPLMHHADAWGCFDSYDGIKARVAEALEAKPASVVLDIDSPGGLVSGVFETARQIRTMCDEAGVALFAYANGTCASAAYALACAARHIATPETGNVGSIGVIAEMVDVSAADKAAGIAWTLVTSGARKADGNMHIPTSEGAVAAVQKQVDYLAGLFFGHVAAFRPDTSPEKVRALEAGLFFGSDALQQSLVDEIATLDQVMSTAAAGTVPTKAATAGSTKMAKASKAMDDAIAALRKAAESDDADEAAKAKRMLAAEYADDDGDKKDDKDAKADSSDDDADKKDDAPPPPEKKDEDAKAIATQALHAVQALRAEQAKTAAETERRELLASRPDFGKEQRATLASAPIETVRDAVKNWPRGSITKAAAAASVAGTRGEGQGEGNASRLPPEEKLALDIAMGIANLAPGIVHEENKMILGAMVPTKTER